jgi:hypothetical protein
MSFAVGYVLSQPAPDRIWGIQIHGFPPKGVFVSPGRSARRYQLVRQLGFVANYGTETGQGGRESRQIDANTTDALLLRGGMADGFLCNCEDPVIAVERDCRFVFCVDSLVPFIYSEKEEARERILDRDGCLASFSKQCFQLHVWYPVEISIEGKPFVCNSPAGPVEGMYFGVFMLAEYSHATKTGVGKLRFVCEDVLDPSLNRVRLHRFCRPVGEASWSVR